MRCKACDHPNVTTINQQIVAGATLRALVASTGVSLGVLSRHRGHIKDLLRESIAREQGERAVHGRSLLNRVEELVDEAQDIVRLAKADKKYAAASNALNSVGRSLELIGKLTGEIALPTNAPGFHLTLNRVTNTIINNYDTDVDFAVMIGEATRGFDVNELKRLQAIATGQDASTTALSQP